MGSGTGNDLPHLTDENTTPSQRHAAAVVVVVLCNHSDLSLLLFLPQLGPKPEQPRANSTGKIKYPYRRMDGISGSLIPTQNGKEGWKEERKKKKKSPFALIIPVCA
jgi:hypothetical protein